jgi:Tfp pilus assembly protein PilW
MASHKNSSFGFSLVELMVGLAAGLIVTTALVAFAFSSMKSNGEYVQSTRLTQELRNTMDLVSRELRRAGYDQDALKYLASGNGSPFSRLELDNANTNPAGTFSCVVYSYDRAETTSGGDGLRETANGEIRAIRWFSRTIDGEPVGVIEYAVSKDTFGVDCDGDSPDYSKYPVACDADSNWCALSDPRRLNVTTFAIGDNRSVVEGVQVRDLDVSIVGGIIGDDVTSREIKSKIRVRSDCYDPSIANCSDNPSP